MSKKKSTYKPQANPELHRAMLEKRRSNAAVPHDNRPKKQRSRAGALNAALKDQKY